jgi:hypothetical protein
MRQAITRIEVVAACCAVAIAAGFLIPSVNRAKSTAAQERCLANLARVGEALGGYLRDSGDTWPYVSKLRSLPLHDPPWPTLPMVLAPYLSGPGEWFRCPADDRLLSRGAPLLKEFGRKTTWYATEGTSYEWLWGEAYGGKKVGEESLSKAGVLGGLERADQPLLADFEPFHAGSDRGSFNTLFADLKARNAKSQHKK